MMLLHIYIYLFHKVKLVYTSATPQWVGAMDQEVTGIGYNAILLLINYTNFMIFFQLFLDGQHCSEQFDSP